MINKILIANRGGIAVDINRACKELGIKTVSIYEPVDQNSLHVRLANESYCLKEGSSYQNIEEILSIAHQTRSDAIHPGYGYLAEKAEFAKACERHHIRLIGPSVDVLDRLEDRHASLKFFKEAGFQVVDFSERVFSSEETAVVVAEAQRIGFPLVLQAQFGQPRRSVWHCNQMDQLLQLMKRFSQRSAEFRFFLEKKIANSHLVRVQIIGDSYGNISQLGERDSSTEYRGRKILEEMPAPFLTQEARIIVRSLAVAVSEKLNLEGLSTVEFLVNEDNGVYLSKVKPYIQNGHSLVEMATGVNLIRCQLLVASQEKLKITGMNDADMGSNLQIRVSAVDVANNFLPTPGKILVAQLPGGGFVRTDTHIYHGYEVPDVYDPLLACISVHGLSRDECLSRLRRVVEETIITGIPTDLDLVRMICDDPGFINGTPNTEFLSDHIIPNFSVLEDKNPIIVRNLAIAASMAYFRRRHFFVPQIPERILTAWHRESRRLS